MGQNNYIGAIAAIVIGISVIMFRKWLAKKSAEYWNDRPTSGMAGFYNGWFGEWWFVICRAEA